MTPRRRRDLATASVDDLRRIIRMLRVSARQAERKVGLSGAQLFVLQKLGKAPARSLNELAERTLTHQSSVSVVVRRLVDRGLVARERSPQDARRVELHLTRSGQRLLGSVPRMPQLQLVDTVRSLGTTDLLALARILRRLVGAIGVARTSPALFFSQEEGRPGRKRRRVHQRRSSPA